MKAAIYCRDLTGPNGMTKSTVLTALALRREGYDIEVLTETAAAPDRLIQFFGQAVRALRIVKIGPPRGAAGRRLVARTAGYDLFINQFPGAYFPSFARRNWLWVHAGPLTRPRHFRFYRIFGNSRQTQKLLRDRWGTRSEILYPPVAVQDFAPRRKERLILSAGSLGGAARPKNELAMIRLFKELHREGMLPGWRYHLVGELEGGPAWLSRLRAEAAGAPVQVQVDAGLADMRRLYGRALLFWHACGASIKKGQKPEGLEPFGIALVEAMAAGCAVLAPAAGGPREIIANGESGWLYHSWRGLRRLTIAAAAGRMPLTRMVRDARARSLRYGTESFQSRLRALLLTEPCL